MILKGDAGQVAMQARAERIAAAVATLLNTGEGDVAITRARAVRARTRKNRHGVRIERITCGEMPDCTRYGVERCATGMWTPWLRRPSFEERLRAAIALHDGPHHDCFFDDPPEADSAVVLPNDARAAHRLVSGLENLATIPGLGGVATLWSSQYADTLIADGDELSRSVRILARNLRAVLPPLTLHDSLPLAP